LERRLSRQSLALVLTNKNQHSPKHTKYGNTIYNKQTHENTKTTEPLDLKIYIKKMAATQPRG